MAVAFESGFAEVNGARLYWEMAGAGEPVVFVHGFTLDTRMWDDQWGAFAERYRVIRYDCRGFGRSSLPGGPFSHQQDLRALMDVLEVSTFHFVGLSMGGGIGVDYAVLRPDDLRSLVLIDSGAGGRSGGAAAYRETALARGVEAAKSGWLADGIFVPASRDPGLKRRLEAIVGDYSGWHWTAESIDQIVPDPPAIERLHMIKAPTLVIVGELDAQRVQENADRLSRQIPGARKLVIRDVGHMSNMEKPAEVNAAIFDFLKAL